MDELQTIETHEAHCFEHTDRRGRQIFVGYNNENLYPNMNARIVCEKFDGSIITVTIKNGYFHSFDDEPADLSELYKVWYREGIPHRESGPAVILNRPDGKQVYFYLNGIRVKLEEFVGMVNITEEDKLELVMRYG